jgi:hypothetical protein
MEISFGGYGQLFLISTCFYQELFTAQENLEPGLVCRHVIMKYWSKCQGYCLSDISPSLWSKCFVLLPCMFVLWHVASHGNKISDDLDMIFIYFKNKFIFWPFNSWFSLILTIELQNRVSLTIQLLNPFTIGHRTIPMVLTFLFKI